MKRLAAVLIVCLMVAVCLGAIRRRTIFPQETRKYSITDPDSLTGPRTPASATATGSKGNVFWDVNHIYVVTDANTWKRSPVYTWGSGYVPVEHINWTAAPNDFSTTGTISGGAITGTTYNGLAIQSAASNFTFTTSGGDTFLFASAAPVGWSIASPSVAGKVLDVMASSILNQDVATTSNPTFRGLTIDSADGSDQIDITHNNTDAYMRWDDGNLIFVTDEGVNTNTFLMVQGKGTGYGAFRCYDQDNAEYVYFTCYDGMGYLKVAGTTPVRLRLQDEADIPITMFESAASGETQELKISGFRAADAKRTLEIGVGVDAADTASFDGVSNYKFDGDVSLAGDTFTIATSKTPASASAVGTTGDMAWDSDYEYRCVATNTWKRAALSTWGFAGETMVYEDGNAMVYEDGNAMVYD